MPACICSIRVSSRKRSEIWGISTSTNRFKSLVHQGVILGPDGMRMSKTRGNVISPDEYIKQYGSDTFRLTLMFGFSYTEGGPWSDDGIKAIGKFLDRIERLADKVCKLKTEKNGNFSKNEKDLDYVRNYTIKCVDKDMDTFSFNTAVARMMEFLNALYKYDAIEEKNAKFMKEAFSDFILLLAPCAPHFSEEIWEMLGSKRSVFLSPYPVCNEAALVKDEVDVAVQFNSKMRGRLVIPTGLDQEAIRNIILTDEKIAPMLEAGKSKS